MSCRSSWCDRASIEEITGTLFRLPERAYCCMDCKAADEGGWHERDGWGEDADHGAACDIAVRIARVTPSYGR